MIFLIHLFSIIIYIYIVMITTSYVRNPHSELICFLLIFLLFLIFLFFYKFGFPIFYIRAIISCYSIASFLPSSCMIVSNRELVNTLFPFNISILFTLTNHNNMNMNMEINTLRGWSNQIFLLLTTPESCWYSQMLCLSFMWRECKLWTISTSIGFTSLIFYPFTCFLYYTIQLTFTTSKFLLI